MNTLSMARKKKEVSPNRQLAQAIIDQYHPQSVEDMQDALKNIFGSMFGSMLQGEMNSHLGYSNNERGEKQTANRRNGYTKKTLKTTAGDLRVSELYKKWNKRPQSNWALVRNQLDMDEKIQERIRKYENGGFRK